MDFIIMSMTCPGVSQTTETKEAVATILAVLPNKRSVLAVLDDGSTDVYIPKPGLVKMLNGKRPEVGMVVKGQVTIQHDGSAPPWMSWINAVEKAPVRTAVAELGRAVLPDSNFEFLKTDGRDYYLHSNAHGFEQLFGQSPEAEVEFEWVETPKGFYVKRILSVRPAESFNDLPPATSLLVLDVIEGNDLSDEAISKINRLSMKYDFVYCSLPEGMHPDSRLRLGSHAETEYRSDVSAITALFEQWSDETGVHALDIAGSAGKGTLVGTVFRAVDDGYQISIIEDICDSGFLAIKPVVASATGDEIFKNSDL